MSTLRRQTAHTRAVSGSGAQPGAGARAYLDVVLVLHARFIVVRLRFVERRELTRKSGPK